MLDLNHQWSSDVSVGPTGDLALASGTSLGQQRILRRLLTSPGDYIWQPGYGAGLAQFIGQPANPAQIRAMIRGQIFQEAAVARSPEPVIDVQVGPDGAGGTGNVYVQILYVDASTGGTQTLSFSVGT